MSKKSSLKKSIISWISVWLVLIVLISAIAFLFQSKGYFHVPTTEEYDNLIYYVDNVKDDILENENIRDNFYNEDMTPITLEVAEGDITSDIEITSEGISVRATKGNCIIEKGYEIKKEYILLEDGTTEKTGVIIVANDPIKEKDQGVKIIFIAAYVIITALMLLALFAVLYSEKRNKKNIT